MKKHLTENFKVKVLSVLVAFAMWVFVMEKIDPIVIRSMDNVEIAEITNLTEIHESGLALSVDQDLTVSIDFRAKRSSLLDYISTSPQVSGKILSPAIGDNVLELTLTAPSDVEYSFDPAVFYVKLEESIIAQKSIEVLQTGTLPDNYSVSDIQFSQSSANVEGPKSQVNKVAKLIAEINVDGANLDYSQRARLVPVDIKGVEVEGVSVDASFVVASIKISQSKEVPIELVFVNSDKEQVSNSAYKSEQEIVTITGAPEKIQSITAVYTQDIDIDSFNRFADREVDLLPIEGVTMSLNRVNIITNEDSEMDFEVSIAKGSVLFDGEVNKEAILEGLPEFIVVSFTGSKEYEGEINDSTVQLIIDNREDLTFYPFTVSIPYPVSSIVVEPNGVSIVQGE